MINQTRRTGMRNIYTSPLLAFTLLMSACDGGIFGTGGPDDMLLEGDDIHSPLSEMDSGIGQNPSSSDELESETPDPTNSATTGENNSEEMNEDNGLSKFENTSETLDSADIRINIFNATTYLVNANERATENAMLLFSTDGVTRNTVSQTVNMTQGNDIRMDIIENANSDSLIFSVPAFNAVKASFTTFIVRQNERTIDVIPLTSITTTNDATLAKVRIVQATTLGNASAETSFKLQSSGANPGGIDEAFGPLSFANAFTVYKDIPSGDYELLDPLNRIPNESLTFEGGNAYTIILLGDDSKSIALVNDTNASSNTTLQ